MCKLLSLSQQQQITLLHKLLSYLHMFESTVPKNVETIIKKDLNERRTFYFRQL